MSDTDKKPSTPTDSPEPELLHTEDESSESTPAPDTTVAAHDLSKHIKAPKRSTYQPSHKATFIGLAVVAAIITINAGVIAFLANGQEKASANTEKDQVTLSAKTLDGLGVSRNPIGNKGTELTVGPKSTFKSDVTVGSDLTVAGKLELKSTFNANNANLANLKAGKTALGQLNVNEDITGTNINIRQKLSVAGETRLQGPVVIDQLLTVNNSVNIAGNVAIGGVLSARNFQANSLVSGSTLTIGGHIITRGSGPSVARGSGLGATSTVSASGNDASGTIAVNVGTDGASGQVAQLAFRSNYGITPHVVVSSVNRYANVYVTRTIGGFDVYVSGSLSTGTYIFDYIVMQ